MKPITFDDIALARVRWQEAIARLPPHLAEYMPRFDAFVGMSRPEMNYAHVDMLLSPHFIALIRVYALKVHETWNRYRVTATRSAGNYGAFVKAKD